VRFNYSDNGVIRNQAGVSATGKCVEEGHPGSGACGAGFRYHANRAGRGR
jgi:hypothetical protein